MKFGKIIRRQAISEEPFASAYVNYKLLKHIIKKLQTNKPSSPRHGQCETKVNAYGEFLFAVAREAHKVDQLYRHQLASNQEEFGPMAEQITSYLQVGERVPAQVIKAFSALCKRLDQLRGVCVCPCLRNRRCMHLRFVLIRYSVCHRQLSGFHEDSEEIRQKVQAGRSDRCSGHHPASALLLLHGLGRAAHSRGAAYHCY